MGLSHGYGIAQFIKQTTGGVLRIDPVAVLKEE